MSDENSRQLYDKQQPGSQQDSPPADHYGTFQHHPPPQSVTGFPQPAPPPGATAHPPHGYQAVPGYVVSEGTPMRHERPLPCCGCGIGWFLFIIGFFLAGIPWYLAAFVMLFSRIDPREKPGYIACIVAAILATIAVIIGATNG